MSIGIAVWGSRIAPLFVTAPEILFISESSVPRRFCFGEEDISRKRVALLEERGVRTLLCGAIPCAIERELTVSGIQVYAFLCGEADELCEIYHNDPSKLSGFRMPGCRRLGRFCSDEKSTS